MKKIISAFICLILMTSIFTGCGSSSSGSSDSKKLKIVTTIFPEYDWVRNIVGDKQNDIDLTMLIDSGVDLHSCGRCAQTGGKQGNDRYRPA